MPLSFSIPQRSSSPLGNAVRWALLSSFGLVVSGCAGSMDAQVGSSLEIEQSREVDEARDASPRDEVSESPSSDTEEGSADNEPDEEPEPPLAHLARVALRAASPPQNHFKLAMAVSERASDLPWILAIENRGTESVMLAALPELLHFTVTLPEEPPTEEEAKDAKKNAKPSEPIVCGPEKFPRSLDEEEQVELPPGELIFHAFDPRSLCDDDSVLKKGAKVEVEYGFPLDTKKLWKGGKLTEVEVEQKAPFVAERESATEEFVPIKHLTAEPFVLGITYPLSSVQPFPEDPNQDASQEGSEPEPPPPLTMTIGRLGEMEEPEDHTVVVTLKNTSGKSMKLFVRRELVTYEVIGPLGGTTCRMYPADRSPDPSAFTTLGAGSSTTLTTRLAEACPQQTWDVPGTYSVSARFETDESGEAHDLNAFVGSAVTEIPARLEVPGDEELRGPTMIIVPSRPER